MTETSYKVETKEIGGHTVKVVLFPGGPGFKLLLELKQVLGDSIGSLFGGQIEVAIAKIGGDLSNENVLDFVLRLLEFTYIDERMEGVNKDFFNEHFAGKYGYLFKVLIFVTEVNFGDFLDETKQGMIAAVAI